MPYTKSKAQISLGSILAIGDGADPEVFTTVGEIKGINQSGRQWATEDVTNMESKKREFIPTLADSGTWQIQGSRVGGDAGQVALETAFNAGALHTFSITLPKATGQTTSGDKFEFTALIQDFNYSFAVDKVGTFTATLKVSGDIDFTAGS
jgi:predicted secreted protein